MICFTGYVNTRFCPLECATDSSGAVVAVRFVVGEPSAGLEAILRARGHDVVERPSRVRNVAKQLREYFAGARRVFDLELRPAGTPFQREVWDRLLGIPYGETRSYGQLAAAMGRPRASRAVGRANATNEIPILIPCHRVIGSTGSLTGFGGGIDLKRRLLEHEAAQLELFATADRHR